MIDEVDSTQARGVQTTEVLAMRRSYHELTQSLTNIKNTIKECIHSLENTIHVKHSILHSIKNAMEDIEHARAVIHQNDTFKHIRVDTSQIQ
jgi:hypothetical protein